MKKKGEIIKSSKAGPEDTFDIQTIEKSIGTAIRKRRGELGLTQDQLAKKLRLSYQQIQKYETGLNRITAGRLFLISKILFTDLDYFFKDSAFPETKETTNKVPTIHIKGEHLNADVQKAIANLVSTMAKNIH
ncbi:MAG: helix-turn-helix transcriptional regulator [Sphingomonadales bacterium]